MTDTARDRLEAALSLMREVSVDPGLGFLKPTADAAAALIAERDTLAMQLSDLHDALDRATSATGATLARAEAAEAKVAAVERDFLRMVGRNAENQIRRDEARDEVTRLRAKVAAVEALIPGCYVFLNSRAAGEVGPEFTCLDITDERWTEAMRCLPCQVRAALADPTPGGES